jgi:hypothetical protein
MVEAPTRKPATVGNSGQVSIGQEFAGREVRIEKYPDVRIAILLGTFVPDHQRTFYTAEAGARLAEFDDWEKENPPDSQKRRRRLRDKLKARSSGE